MKRILLSICWLLEDIADKLTHNHADWFYLSEYFEKEYKGKRWWFYG